MSAWIAVSEDDSDEEFGTAPLHHSHTGHGLGADGVELGGDGGEVELRRYGGGGREGAEGDERAHHLVIQLVLQL